MIFARLLRSDSAENSIMQTITIAVSAILIAAGLITAPGLINNARDNNVRGDLANIAYAQEVLMADDGTYSNKVNKIDADVDGWFLGTQPNIKYTLSDDVDSSALVCNDPEWAYLLRAESDSGAIFYRSSSGAKTSTNIGSLTIADCIINHADYGDFTAGASFLSFLADPDLGMNATGSPVDIELVDSSLNLLSLEVIEGALPDGLGIQETSLRGAPTKNGTYDFTIEAKTETETVSREFTMKVTLTASPNWTASMPINDVGRNWIDVAHSDNGLVLAATALNGYVYTSKDGGATWKEATTLGVGSWRVAVNPAGNQVLVIKTGTRSSYYNNLTNDVWSNSGGHKDAVHYDVTYNTNGQPNIAGQLSGNSYTMVYSGLNAWVSEYIVGGPTGAFGSVLPGASNTAFTVHIKGKNMIQTGSSSTNVAGASTGLAMGRYNTNGRIYAVTANGILYNNWAAVHSNMGTGWTDIDGSSDNSRIVGIQNGKIMVSADGGQTWNDQSPNASETYVDVETIAGNKMIAVSSGSGHVYIGAIQ